MKKVLLVIALTVLMAAPSFAKTKEIQFKLVLSAEEAKSAANKKYKVQIREDQEPQNVHVGKEALLTNTDIASIVIRPDADKLTRKYPVLDIIFTPEGSEKLKDVTTKYLQKRIAILIDGEVLGTPYMVYPLTKGHLLLSSWKINTPEAAEKLIKDLGF